MQSHHKAAASVIAEALEAAKRSVASKTGKLKEAENRSLEAPLAAAGNGWSLDSSQLKLHAANHLLYRELGWA